MKKTFKLLICVLSVLVLTACNQKSITRDEFVSKLEEKGYTVLKVDEEYEEVKNAAIASKDDLQILFYTFKSNESAKTFYLDSKRDFEEIKGTNIADETNKDNYSNYRVMVDGEYYIVSRVSETVIYIRCNSSYSNEVDNILYELNY